MFEQLESALAEITGFAEFLSSPMLAHRPGTRDYLLFVSTTNTGVKVWNICLIPSQLMGQILLVAALWQIGGDRLQTRRAVDLDDLKAEEHSNEPP